MFKTMNGRTHPKFRIAIISGEEEMGYERGMEFLQLYFIL